MKELIHWAETGQVFPLLRAFSSQELGGSQILDLLDRVALRLDPHEEATINEYFQVFGFQEGVQADRFLKVCLRRLENLGELEAHRGLKFVETLLDPFVNPPEDLPGSKLARLSFWSIHSSPLLSSVMENLVNFRERLQNLGSLQKLGLDLKLSEVPYFPEAAFYYELSHQVCSKSADPLRILQGLATMHSLDLNPMLQDWVLQATCLSTVQEGLKSMDTTRTQELSETLCTLLINPTYASDSEFPTFVQWIQSDFGFLESVPLQKRINQLEAASMMESFGESGQDLRQVGSLLQESVRKFVQKLLELQCQDTLPALSLFISCFPETYTPIDLVFGRLLILDENWEAPLETLPSVRDRLFVLDALCQYWYDRLNQEVNDLRLDKWMWALQVFLETLEDSVECNSCTLEAEDYWATDPLVEYKWECLQVGVVIRGLIEFHGFHLSPEVLLKEDPLNILAQILVEDPSLEFDSIMEVGDWLEVPLRLVHQLVFDFLQKVGDPPVSAYLEWVNTEWIRDQDEAHEYGCFILDYFWANWGPPPADLAHHWLCLVFKGLYQCLLHCEELDCVPLGQMLENVQRAILILGETEGGNLERVPLLVAQSLGQVGDTPMIMEGIQVIPLIHEYLSSETQILELFEEIREAGCLALALNLRDSYPDEVGDQLEFVDTYCTTLLHRAQIDYELVAWLSQRLPPKKGEAIRKEAVNRLQTTQNYEALALFTEITPEFVWAARTGLSIGQTFVTSEILQTLILDQGSLEEVLEFGETFELPRCVEIWFVQKFLRRELCPQFVYPSLPIRRMRRFAGKNFLNPASWMSLSLQKVLPIEWLDLILEAREHLPDVCLARCILSDLLTVVYDFASLRFLLESLFVLEPNSLSQKLLDLLDLCEDLPAKDWPLVISWEDWHTVFPDGVHHQWEIRSTPLLCLFLLLIDPNAWESKVWPLMAELLGNYEMTHKLAEVFGQPDRFFAQLLLNFLQCPAPAQWPDMRGYPHSFRAEDGLRALKALKSSIDLMVHFAFHMEGPPLSFEYREKVIRLEMALVNGHPLLLQRAKKKFSDLKVHSQLEAIGLEGLGHLEIPHLLEVLLYVLPCLWGFIPLTAHQKRVKALLGSPRRILEVCQLIMKEAEEDWTSLFEGFIWKTLDGPRFGEPLEVPSSFANFKGQNLNERSLIFALDANSQISDLLSLVFQDSTSPTAKCRGFELLFRGFPREGITRVYTRGLAELLSIWQNYMYLTLFAGLHLPQEFGRFHHCDKERLAKSVWRSHKSDQALALLGGLLLDFEIQDLSLWAEFLGEVARRPPLFLEVLVRTHFSASHVYGTPQFYGALAGTLNALPLSSWQNPLIWICFSGILNLELVDVQGLAAQFEALIQSEEPDMFEDFLVLLEFVPTYEMSKVVAAYWKPGMRGALRVSEPPVVAIFSENELENPVAASKDESLHILDSPSSCESVTPFGSHN